MSTIWVRSLSWTLVLALICCLVPAEEWNRFRGPNGSGMGTVADLPTEFGVSHHVTWKAEVPFGRSSPVVSGRHIFLTGVEDGQLVVMALERSTGRLAWKRAVERVRDPEMYHGTDSATPTPVTDGSNFYVFFPDARVFAFGYTSQRVKCTPRQSSLTASSISQPLMAKSSSSSPAPSGRCLPSTSWTKRSMPRPP